MNAISPLWSHVRKVTIWDSYKIKETYELTIDELNSKTYVEEKVVWVNKSELMGGIDKPKCFLYVGCKDLA